MHMDLGSWDNNPIALNKQNGYWGQNWRPLSMSNEPRGAETNKWGEHFPHPHQVDIQGRKGLSHKCTASTLLSQTYADYSWQSSEDQHSSMQFAWMFLSVVAPQSTTNPLQKWFRGWEILMPHMHQEGKKSFIAHTMRTSGGEQAP